MNLRQLLTKQNENSSFHTLNKQTLTNLRHIQTQFSNQCSFLEISIPKNQYIGIEGAKSISELIQSYQILKQLKLTFTLNNEITSEGFEKVCQAINLQTALESLYVEIQGLNRIDAKGLLAFSNCLKQQSNLKELTFKISRNYIKEGIKEFAEGISHLSNLISLNLKLNRAINIGQEKMEELKQGLIQLTNLKYFTLKIGWQSKILSQGAAHIGEALKKLTNLEILKLHIDSDNQIGSKGLSELSEGIKKLNKLKFLSIKIGYQNNIENEGLLKLGEAFENLKQLQEIKFQLKMELKNKYKFIDFGSGLADLNLPNLSFKLILNNIEINKMEKLEQGLRQLNKLKRFQLSINQFDDPKDYITNSFKGMSSLENLFLSIDSTLSTNEIVGECLPYLRQLKQLSLILRNSKSYLSTFENLNKLCNGLELLQNLDSLSIDLSFQNLINSKSYLGLIDALRSLRNLKKLELFINGNAFESEMKYNLVSTLSNLNNLTHLTICTFRQQYFKDSIDYDLGNAFKHLPNLTYLNYKVEENNFNMDQNALLLGNGFVYLNKLTELYLNFGKENKIRLDGIKGLSLGLSHLKQLKILSLIFQNVNYICPESTQYLGDTLANLKMVSYLELTIKQSSFNYELIQNLYNGIKQMDKLVDLKLDILDVNSILFVKLIKDLKLIQSHTFSLSNQPYLAFVKENINNDIGEVENFKVTKLDLYIEKVNDVIVNNFMSIGESIKELIDLTYLSIQIDYINLAEEAAQFLGESLKGLVKLTYLSLKVSGKNKIGGQGALSIGNGISKLVKLKSLTLHFEFYNEIDSQGSLSIAKSIQNLLQLENLDLSFGTDNNFDSESMIELGKSLSLNSSINCLSIRLGKGNTINQQGMVYLGLGLKNLNNLKALSLVIMKGDQIGIEGIKSIVDNLENKQLLRKLNLNIDDPQQSLFLNLLQTNSMLEDPQMLNNYIDIFDYQIFHQNLIELSIQITKNQMAQTGIIGIAQALSNFIYLTKLDIILQKNQIKTAGAQYLGKALSNLINLNYLSLVIHANDIGKDGAISLSNGISLLVNLSYLNYCIQSCNFIEEEGGESIGNCISSLIKMKNLIITVGCDNKIGSRTGISIGKGLSHLKQLESVIIDFSQSTKIGEDACNQISEGLQSKKELKKLELNIYDPSNLQSLSFLINTEMQYLKIPQINSFEFERVENKIIKLSLELIPQKLGISGTKSFQQGISQLIHLTDLHLVIKENDIRSVGAEHIGKGLKPLTQLVNLYLYIQKNDLKCAGVRYISEGIENLTELKQLTIIYSSENLIYEEGGMYIGKSLRNLIKLQNLTIKIHSSNNIGKLGAMNLGQSIKNLTNLITFELVLHKDNQIELEGAKSIINELKKLKNLQKIIFDVDDKSGSYIISLIGDNPHQIEIQQPYIVNVQSQFIDNNPYYLSFYVVRQNDIIEIGAEAVGKGLGQLPSLQNLKVYIQHAFLDPKSIQGFADGLKHLVLLSELYIEMAEFGSIQTLGAFGFRDALSQMVNLQNLVLIFGKHNCIGEEGGVALGEGLGKLLKLKNLKLQIGQNNDINIVGAQGIFDGIKLLKNLEKVDLRIDNYGNCIFLYLINELPLLTEDNITLTNIDQIQFQRNKGQLTNLQFRMTESSFDIEQGGIEFFEKMKDLVYLDELEFTSESKKMNNNSTEEFGRSLARLSNLKVLRMTTYKNKLRESGVKSLTTGLRCLKNLQELSLYFAQYTTMSYSYYEEIIKCLPSIPKLETLVLSDHSNFKMNNATFQCMTESISKLIHLQNLTINTESEADINSYLSQFLEKGIKPLINLKHLHLKLGQIENTKSILQSYSESFEKVLPTLENLVRLILVINSQNLLKIKGITQIYNGIKQLKKLEFLQLDFKEDFNIVFFSLINHLPLIKSRQMQIEKSWVNECKREILNDQSVIECELNPIISLNLNLSNYFLQKEIIFQEFNNHLLQFQNLIYLKISLYLKENRLGQILIEGLKQLKSLHYLNLIIYPINNEPDQLWFELCRLTNLRHLYYFSNNRLLQQQGKNNIIRKIKRLVTLKK